METGTSVYRLPLWQPNHRWISKHALSINGKRQDITKENFLTIGKSVSLKKAAYDR